MKQKLLDIQKNIDIESSRVCGGSNIGVTGSWGLNVESKRCFALFETKKLRWGKTVKHEHLENNISTQTKHNWKITWQVLNISIFVCDNFKSHQVFPTYISTLVIDQFIKDAKKYSTTRVIKILLGILLETQFSSLVKSETNTHARTRIHPF